MILETLQKCNWGEIKVDEIFALEGCWEIYCKINDDFAFNLASTHDNHHDFTGTREEFDEWNKNEESFYKLPLSTQHLWKEE